MNTETKEQIKSDLANYVSKIGGQSAASRQLSNVSNATISNILAGKWDNIADTMWLSIQKQVKQSDWLHAETVVSSRLYRMYADAQANQEVRGATANAGRGKTHTAKRFVADNETAFLVSCDQLMKINDFLGEILRVLGKTKGGLNPFETLNYIADELIKLDNPIIIFDEFDKLKNVVKFLFISLYNRTEDRVSYFIQGAPFLRKSLVDLARKDKIGAAETISRLNGKIIDLGENTESQLQAIAAINGLKDEELRIRTVNDADFDLRRLKSQIKVALRKEGRAAQ